MRQRIAGVVCMLMLFAAVACGEAPAAANGGTPAAATAAPGAEVAVIEQQVTLAATEAPTPEPVTDEALDAGALDGFFDGAVLIGDSLTAGLTSYVLARRGHEGEPDCLGQLRFISASAFYLERAYLAEKGEYFAALNFRGKYMTVSDVIVAAEATRAFILLGTDDINLREIAETIDYMRQIVANIQQKAPAAQVILIAPPPVLASYAAAQGDYGPELNAAYNTALQALCEELGVSYMELGAYVRGEDGYLIPDYCIDEKFHFNNKGKELWVHRLRAFAREQYDKGLYTP